RELAALHQLVDERVILSELLDPALADEVRAGVADVSERDAIVLGERNGDRRTHARGVRIGARPVVDATVRLLDQVEDPILPAAADRALAEGRSCEARRDLTRLRAAHAVRNREERRLANVRVLIAPSLAPGVGDDGDAADHASYLR